MLDQTKICNMKVLSVNLGKPTTFLWNKKEEQTGMFKFPVDSPIFLGKEVVKNDTIVNRKHHGGIDQAVYGYSQKHYGHFKELHPNLEWDYGMFGENITFSDLDEEEVMLVTNKGKLIRLPVNGIRIAGRVTQGVTLLNTEKSERVVSVTKVKMNIEQETDE